MLDLTPEEREARRLYKREWNRANKDKVRASQKKWWAKKAKEMKQAREQEH